MAQAFDLDPGMTPEEILAGAVASVRALQAECGFSNAKFKGSVDDADIKNLCAAIELDPCGAMYQMPKEVAKSLSDGCF